MERVQQRGDDSSAKLGILTRDQKEKVGAARNQVTYSWLMINICMCAGRIVYRVFLRAPGKDLGSSMYAVGIGDLTILSISTFFVGF